MDRGPNGSFDDLTDPQLLEKIRGGDSRAERLLFDRYYQRIVGFARARMNARLQVRVAASDVAASAMKSVLLGLRPGEFQLGHGDCLWPLLVTVTLNKIRNQWRRQTSQQQDIRRTNPLAAYELLLQDDPRHAGEAALNDLVHHLLELFPARRQQIVRLALEGHGVGEIATSVGVSERTVYETRREAARSLKRLLDELNQ